MRVPTGSFFHRHRWMKSLSHLGRWSRPNACHTGGGYRGACRRVCNMNNNIFLDVHNCPHLQGRSLYKGAGYRPLQPFLAVAMESINKCAASRNQRIGLHLLLRINKSMRAPITDAPELLRNPCILCGPQTKRDELRSGCLTPAFSGAQKRVELLCNPCVLGGPQQMGKNEKWLPHPCLLRGPKESGIAT